MEPFAPELIKEMRSMARGGALPSEILRMLVQRLHQPSSLTIRIIQYFQAAFFLSLTQIKELLGLYEERIGVNDLRPNDNLTSSIAANRSQWDRDDG